MASKPKRGRPPAAGVARSERVEIRATPEEVERWRKSANGASLSKWIRERLDTGD